MPDQAQDLRRLALRQPCGQIPRVGRPAVLAVAGGKGGVGTTSVAIGVARGLARAGSRVMLIDADPSGGNVALLCGVEPRHPLADVLAGRNSLTEAAMHGPDDIRLLAGDWAWPERFGSPSVAAHRLLRLLGDVPAGEVVVIDVGDLSAGVAPHLCRRADAVLLVTTAEAPSLIGTLAAIKAIAASRPATLGQQPDVSVSHALRPEAVLVLLNKLRSTGQAATAYRRLAWACYRLLGIKPNLAGHIAAMEDRSSIWRAVRSQAPWTARSVFPTDTIGLNVPAGSVDMIRRALLADALLSGRSRVEYGGPPPTKAAGLVIPAPVPYAAMALGQRQATEARTTSRVPEHVGMDF